jgi:HAD superfamily hydrolase (TIGR01509 family)
MSRPVAVVFDLGNVLLPINLDLTYAAFASYTHYFSAEEIKYSTEQESLWLPYESGLVSCAQFRASICTRFQMECTDAEFDHAFSALLLDFPTDVVLIIEEVKANFPVYLLSNTSRIHSQLFLQNESLFSKFESLHLSYEMGLSKPDKRIYQQVVDANALHEKQIIFFDDNSFNVQSANEFGWDAVLIDPKQSFLQIRNHISSYVN